MKDCKNCTTVCLLRELNEQQNRTIEALSKCITVTPKQAEINRPKFDLIFPN